jgi:hypothetical protein
MTQRDVLPIASVLLRRYNGHRTAAPRDVPGIRLLLTDRAAMLRSGSPPGVGPTLHAAQFFCVPSSPFNRTGVSELFVLVLAILAECGLTEARLPT